MSPRDTSERRSLRSSRRVTKACRRCRDQKIRCTGSYPCDQCRKRNSTCQFDNQSEKVVVTRRYISDLHQRLATSQHRSNQSTSSKSPREQLGNPPYERDDAALLSQSAVGQDQSSKTQDEREAKAPLINPLAFHITDWVLGPTGKPVFMGTSSSWAFSRRVLGMTHERLTGSPLFPDPDRLLFDDHVYDLKWDGNKANLPEDIFDISTLPAPDFSKYLINSVKFHCGQLFYLFDENRFMEQFTSFQQNPTDKARSSPLWFCHYLLILAFGKSFVVQSARSKSPPGAEHFVQAMQCMPDFTFFDGDPIEKIQVLCCAALYLQCVHSRGPAYRMIGTALRLALEDGMYTGMHGTCLDEVYVQRCSLMWWTVYVLERRMCSLLGVPMGISEESISTSFPSISKDVQGPNILEMHVMLCQILAKVDLTVYGKEGKLDSRYLGATQSVLRDIAKVTEHLNSSFDLYANGAMGGTSRISAHLHILQHQCIILTTRPLLYIFLQSKLGQSDPSLMDWLQSATVKSLLQICVESAQQILRILSNLLEQGLLETFLPFDMDAAVTSTIPLLMAASIDSSLLQDHSPWSQRAYAILDEMSIRGNLSAKLVRSELKQLDDELTQLLMRPNMGITLPTTPLYDPVRGTNSAGIVPPVPGSGQLELDFAGDFGQHYELSSDQLMELANSLDLNSLTWPIPPMDEMAGSGV